MTLNFSLAALRKLHVATAFLRAAMREEWWSMLRCSLVYPSRCSTTHPDTWRVPMTAMQGCSAAALAPAPECVPAAGSLLPAGQGLYTFSGNRDSYLSATIAELQGTITQVGSHSLASLARSSVGAVSMGLHASLAGGGL